MTRSDCSWVRPLTISTETYQFLAENVENPEVRSDIDQLVSHNEVYEKICGAQATS